MWTIWENICVRKLFFTLLFVFFSHISHFFCLSVFQSLFLDSNFWMWTWNFTSTLVLLKKYNFWMFRGVYRCFGWHVSWQNWMIDFLEQFSRNWFFLESKKLPRPWTHFYMFFDIEVSYKKCFIFFKTHFLLIWCTHFESRWNFMFFHIFVIFWNPKNFPDFRPHKNEISNSKYTTHEIFIC